MPRGAEILTVEFKVNLMAPAKGEAFAFLGRVVRPGRTITVSAAEAFALDSDGPRLIALMSGTMMNIQQRASSPA
jgi:acyl-coenzyme A thioesterase PaaI-like protein